MKSNTINHREVKSLRLLLRTQKLKTILETKNPCLFAMTETLHPTQRILIRKDLVEHGLNMAIISKTTANFLTKNKKWKSIKNLLSGNVVAITDNKNKEISKNALKYVVSNKNLTPRFLFWNQNIHRKNNIQNYVTNTNNLPIEKTLKHLVLNPYIFINPFIKRSNDVVRGVQTLTGFIPHDRIWRVLKH